MGLFHESGRGRGGDDQRKTTGERPGVSEGGEGEDVKIEGRRGEEESRESPEGVWLNAASSLNFIHAERSDG